MISRQKTLLTWVTDGLRRMRRAGVIAFHAALCGISLYCAFLIKFDCQIPALYKSTILNALIVMVVVRVPVLSFFRLHSGLLRRASFYDLVNIIKAVTLGSLIFALLNLFFSTRTPTGVIVIDWFLISCGIGGVRMAFRIWGQRIYPKEKSRKTLFIGKLHELELIMNYLKTSRQLPYYPVACLDEELVHKGVRINGVPVLNRLEKIPNLIRKLEIEEVLFCSSEPLRGVMNRVVEACSETQVNFSVLPGLDHLFNGRVEGPSIRDLQVEDLLEREPVSFDERTLMEHLRGKRILVTGVGGSIGRELSLQLAKVEPELIVLFDRYESSLYSIELELARRFPNQPLKVALGTISDVNGLLRLIETAKVDIIFHCAAYKHVPVIEMNPIEAAYNNILGTRHIAYAAHARGVKKFVMISTDKAVSPRCIMGASKRLGEMYIRALNERSLTKFTTVRFGNVLNSNGSVIPRFLAQIRAGGPVTVTHPDMERFLMTIPEACQLVLQASSMGNGGEIFVLKMGESVKIMDLARKMIRIAGLREGKDIEIVTTGCRPGEKLHEQLFDKDERRISTSNHHINEARGCRFEFEHLEAALGKIENMVREGDEVGLIRLLNQVVPNCSCGKEILAAYGELYAEAVEVG